jgi:streptogramin lyase
MNCQLKMSNMVPEIAASMMTWIKTCFIMLMGIFLIPFCSIAGIGDWKNYTDMSNVVSLASSRNEIWAGTSGGLFRLSLSDSSFQKFTNSEGLTGNDVTAVALDAFGTLWIGHQSGAIDAYSPKTNSWRYVSDIVQSTKVQKSINAFYIAGDSIYIASGFGVSVFSISKFEFKDTYGNFATFAQPNVTSVLAFGGRVFAATSSGIAVSNPGAFNLDAPESWTPFSSPANPTDLSVFNGEVYVSTSTGVFVFQNNNWVPVNGLSQPAVALVSTDSVLFVVDSAAITTFSRNGIVSSYGIATPVHVNCAIVDSVKTFVVGLQEGGIARFDAQHLSWTATEPNSPASNFFISVAVDDNGVIWGASGTNNGHGFYSFDGTKWRNYNTTTIPALLTNDYFSVNIGPNNSKWAGSWGKGIALLDSKGDFVRLFNHNSPGFVGIPEDTLYNVMPAAAADYLGDVWVTNYSSADLGVLWEMSPDSIWTEYKSPSGYGYKQALNLVIDRNGTKWFTSALPFFIPISPTFFFFNESLALDGTVNGWGTMDEHNGLTSSTVTSIALDNDGEVWLGTALGITVIAEPRFPTSSVSQVYLGAVYDQFINCIVVDPLNNKWVGTKNGVLVLSPDGTSLLQQYSVASTNGKLVDNNVLSIAFDKKRGIAYFGTENGLSSLEIPIIQPAEQFSKLRVGPNPFIIPSSGTVTISGLVDNSVIKILTLNGTLVKEFQAQGGGRAFWDGKDSDEKLVGSGIYFLVAYDITGTQVSTAKIAVIRR